MKVYTNHHVREFKYRHDVPSKVFKDYLDWCFPEDDFLYGFIHYGGRWYHTDEFMIGDHVPAPVRSLGYDAWLSDSYFSGIALKVIDGDSYQIATVID